MIVLKLGSFIETICNLKLFQIKQQASIFAEKVKSLTI